MAIAPAPDKIYERAEAEGERRLSMTVLEEGATGFIAGVTIVFGITAWGMVESWMAPAFGDGPGRVAGALAFAIGLVFLVVGRSELFTENLFDPVAAALAAPTRKKWWGLGRLWALVLLFNLIGGAAMVLIFSIPGALPSVAHDTLNLLAEETAGNSPLATFARAIAAGTLLTLLSFLLNAVDSVASRIALAFMVGFFLALGPFDHVVVSALMLLFGVLLGGDVDYGDVGVNIGVATAGNLLGGILLMTVTHVVQHVGARRSSED
ncbi:formate/nitrite transporter family protein [Microbacterium sp. HD4P20]|uniref:formate/nitrite transporter family protein n=1 Tax=Microbacterium sp. HD4P20 TaxID=2864874 RepID=UPI001C63FFEA|nr:formate/nitrite transporter family protein [Microbacterium sp. HD4P20]MCP2635898.1 formate/nitrite transporter family protein [Microbacterium sp. HD4P20]